MRTAPAEARLRYSGRVQLHAVMAANTEHEALQPLQPSDWNIKVWRYMDLPKLIDFLETASIHFSRADTLGDPYEGSWTRLDVAAREELHQSIAAEHGVSKSLALERYRDHSKAVTQQLREMTYISCWHAAETESAAMWRLYGTADGSVAIQSTYGKLAGALPSEAYLGMVRYMTYHNFENWIPRRFVMSPFMHKRSEFEHEKEIRALIVKRRTEASGRTGFKVGIDIGTTVETVRVQPTTPAWIRDAIERLLERYGWGIKVIPSDIDLKPLY